jgi:RimJ/RimL family protein N-acetyltransferase
MINLFNRPVANFSSKSGKKINIFQPSMDRLPELLKFINRLVAEDTYLNLSGRAKTFEEEERWLKGTLTEIKTGKNILFWACYEDTIVGSVNILHGYERSWHVGKIGLMIDKDFRREGIGKFLLELILEKAKDFDIRIATLEVFSDNVAAISLYEKVGFRVYGRLPKGLFRKGKFSDTIEMLKEVKSS